MAGRRNGNGFYKYNSKKTKEDHVGKSGKQPSVRKSLIRNVGPERLQNLNIKGTVG